MEKGGKRHFEGGVQTREETMTVPARKYFPRRISIFFYSLFVSLRSGVFLVSAKTSFNDIVAFQVFALCTPCVPQFAFKSRANPAWHGK